MLNKVKMTAKGNVALNVLQINNHPIDNNVERDIEVIGLCRELKRLASESDFDVLAHQDKIWRMADKIQILIEDEV